jgi:hypothetical protein
MDGMVKWNMLRRAVEKVEAETCALLTARLA